MDISFCSSGRAIALTFADAVLSDLSTTIPRDSGIILIELAVGGVAFAAFNAPSKGGGGGVSCSSTRGDLGAPRFEHSPGGNRLPGATRPE